MKPPLAVAVAAALSLAAAPAPGRAEAGAEDPRAVYRVPVDGSPARGASAALVTIVESSDFECPFSKQVQPTLARVAQAYGGKVRFVFKHNPLSFHAGALPAAKLAEAARLQGGEGKFWEVHDRLFALASLDRGALEALGREVGLSADAVRRGLETQDVERIRRDQNLVNALGARGTPTFFVNGRKVVGALPFEAFQQVIDEELARAEALARTGVAPQELYARLTAQGATAPVPLPGSAPANAAAARVIVRADDPVRGPRLAPVTLVLFSDFQCPFCGKVEPTVEQLRKVYGDKVRVIWKHQPLPMHANALPAARAAEAARAQGKFWEMHDRLFAGQQGLSPAAYEQAARALGLDLARFQRELASAAAGRRIAEDQAQAAQVGATGTPTLFVNCRKISGAQPLEAFRRVIDEELRKAAGQPVDVAYYDRACAANVAAAPPPAAPRTALQVALRADDPARGPRGARLTVVEFSDFQCPFCGRALPALAELERSFPGQVRVSWKHLPLPFHPSAMPAALAAEAARQQGKFWEMHDKLFAGQQALSDEAYARFARELGLDLARFERARKDPATRARVEEDARAAAAAGVTGTPSFVVGGELVLGSSALKEAVQRHLAKLAAR